VILGRAGMTSPPSAQDSLILCASFVIASVHFFRRTASASSFSSSTKNTFLAFQPWHFLLDLLPPSLCFVGLMGGSFFPSSAHSIRRRSFVCCSSGLLSAPASFYSGNHLSPQLRMSVLSPGIRPSAVIFCAPPLCIASSLFDVFDNGGGCV